MYTVTYLASKMKTQTDRQTDWRHRPNTTQVHTPARRVTIDFLARGDRTLECTYDHATRITRRPIIRIGLWNRTVSEVRRRLHGGDGGDRPHGQKVVGAMPSSRPTGIL